MSSSKNELLWTLAGGAAAVAVAAAAIATANQQETRYTEAKAAKIAYEEEGVTVLLTNEGKLYRSTSSRHAEVVMAGSAIADKITKIWIKTHLVLIALMCL